MAGVGGEGSASKSDDKIIALSTPALQNNNQLMMNTREDPTRSVGARKQGKG